MKQYNPGHVLSQLAADPEFIHKMLTIIVHKIGGITITTDDIEEAQEFACSDGKNELCLMVRGKGTTGIEFKAVTSTVAEAAARESGGEVH